MGRFVPYRKRRGSLLFFCTVTIIVALIVTLLADAKIRPIVRQLAESQAQSLATRAIDGAVTEVLAREGTDYDDLVQISSNENGMITSIRSRTVEINKLKAELSEQVLSAVESCRKKELLVPVGNVLGSDLFAGRGPGIKLYLTLSASTNMQIRNVFESTGINQTRHQVLLDVEAKIQVLMTGGSLSTSVKTNFTVAETVIVGTVPQTYLTN